MFYTIYKVTNTKNSMVYVGLHKTKQLNDGYMGSGKAIIEAIKNEGKENFTKEVLFVFDNELDMVNKEKEIVDKEFVESSETYNMTIGGYNRGYYYANEHGLNIASGQCYIAGNRVKTDPEYKKEFVRKVSEGLSAVSFNHATFAGKEHSTETKKKISSVMSIKQGGKNNSQYGSCWIHSLELKKSMKIKKDDLQQWLDTGWLSGRKMKF